MKDDRLDIAPAAAVAGITSFLKLSFLRQALSPRPDLAGRAPLLLAVLVSLVFLCIQPAFATEEVIEVVPRWVRPNGTVTVKLGPEVDTAKITFLRLSGRATVRDFPLDVNQIRRRIVEVRIPETMRAGNYETSLVDENGRELVARGSRLKIAASDKAEEKPVITRIVPAASYATNGRYDFDIIGENFGDDVRGIKILINDTVCRFESTLREHGGETSVKDCGEKLPCLIWGWKKLGIRGFSVKGQHITRPMTASVEIDGIESNRKTLVLSPVDRATPGVIAFAALGVLTALVYLLTRRKAAQRQVNGRSNTMSYLFIDSETNTYSLSQLQLLLWSAAAVVAYVYLAASQSLVQWNWALPKVPENLPTLLGISAGTTALAIGATGMRGSKGSGPLHPEPGDFITSGGVFAPERLQFFLWTVLGIFGFLSATLAQDPATVTELPQIPDSFVPLMGLSSLGYLAGKVARKPGPNIRQLAPPPPYAAAGKTIRIIGENLSPRAQVWLNGDLLQTGEISVGPKAQADTQFVTELILKPTTIAPAASGVSVIKVLNPDGQSAEK
ncbi:MAG: IPT/TIG domain-containing protein [Pseudomonadota bacterium]